MKLKIQIYGSRIHDVDYRPWLTDAAINAGLDGFYASNRVDEMIHSILVLAEGDADSIMRFEMVARGNRPLHANVDRIDVESFSGSVMPLYRYAAINTSSQMNKLISSLENRRKTGQHE